MMIKTETTVTFYYPEEMEAEVSFVHDNDMSEWVQEEFGDGSISYTLTKEVDVELGKAGEQDAV